VHDLGPEIRRAISGNLEEEALVERRGSEEPMHRVSIDDSNESCFITSSTHFFSTFDLPYSLLLSLFIYLFITKGPTGHLQCYTETQKYNKTQ